MLRPKARRQHLSQLPLVLDDKNFLNLHNELLGSQGHWHFFEIQTRSGARFGYLFETGQDRPDRPFTIYQDVTDRRDTSAFTPDEVLGRSFVVKYTRLFDF